MRLGQSLAGVEALMQANLELWGPLGAGKTTLVRAILRGLGVQGRIKSPTYAVMESYAVPRGEITHFDFFRFQDPREWEEAGFRDVFSAPGLKISEWPEMAAAALPTPDLRIHIQPAEDDRREVRLEAFTPRGMALLAAADAATTPEI